MGELFQLLVPPVRNSNHGFGLLVDRLRTLFGIDNRLQLVILSLQAFQPGNLLVVVLVDRLGRTAVD